MSVRVANRDPLSRGLPENLVDCGRPARVSQLLINAMLHNKAEDR